MKLAASVLAVLLLSSCYSPDKGSSLFKKFCVETGGIITFSESGFIGFRRITITCNRAHVVNGSMSDYERTCLLQGGYIDYSFFASSFDYNFISSCVMEKQ